MSTAVDRPGGRKKQAAKSSARGKLSLDSVSVHETVKRLEKGLPARDLVRLRTALDVSWSELGQLVQIPPRTLSRRRQSGRLLPDESERVLRVARIFDLALGLFEGDLAATRHWLKQPVAAVRNESPLNYSRTEPGGRAVEQLIGRLEHGVFS